MTAKPAGQTPETTRTFDAQTWAKSFNETLVKLGYQPHDEGWLIGWFANAIMCGFDEAQHREKRKAAAMQTSAEQLQSRVKELKASLDSATFGWDEANKQREKWLERAIKAEARVRELEQENKRICDLHKGSMQEADTRLERVETRARDREQMWHNCGRKLEQADAELREALALLERVRDNGLDDWPWSVELARDINAALAEREEEKT